MTDPSQRIARCQRQRDRQQGRIGSSCSQFSQNEFPVGLSVPSPPVNISANKCRKSCKIVTLIDSLEFCHLLNFPDHMAGRGGAGARPLRHREEYGVLARRVLRHAPPLRGLLGHGQGQGQGQRRGPGSRLRVAEAGAKIHRALSTGCTKLNTLPKWKYTLLFSAALQGDRRSNENIMYP